MLEYRLGSSQKLSLAELTITLDNQTKVYGSADPELTYTVTGLINNNIVQDTEEDLNIVVDRVDGENVGEYAISATAKNDNYVITINEDALLTITKAPVTVTMDKVTKTYGEDDKLSVTTKLADDFTATDAGTYEDAITATVGENTNYTVTVANATLTIAPANITAVEIVIDPATTDVYTAEDQVTITITAKNGDKVVVDKALVDGTYTITTTDAEGNTVAVADLATALQTAGVYTFTPDVNKENKNYVVAADAVKTATLTVEKKTITVTVADIETDTAAPVPTITPVVVDAEGKPVDNADLEITITDAAENEVTLAEAVAKKGTYKITVTVGNENYIVSEQSDLEAILTVRHYVAKVGETKYESLQEAVNVAGANGIVDLLIDTDEIVIVRYPLVINRVNGATITEGLFTGKGLDYTEDDVAYIVSAITCTPEDLGPAVAYIDINDDGSLNGSEVTQPLQTALDDAVAGQTVRLTGDLDLSDATIIIPTNINLDIQSNTHAVRILVGLKGSTVYADTIANDGTGDYGILKVAKDNVVLSEAAFVAASTENYDMTVLPIWNPDEGHYEFSRFILWHNATSAMGLEIDEAEEHIKFVFRHQNSTYYQSHLLNESGLDSGVKVVLEVSWTVMSEDGKSVLGTPYQTFVYNDDFFSTVAAGGWNYTFNLTGYSAMFLDLSTMKIVAKVVSDTGATAFGKTIDYSFDELK